MKDVKERQADSITEYVMGYLMESLKQNLFPKRAVIPVKTPSKEEDYLSS